MPRLISWFDKTKENLCGEKIISDIPVSELRKFYPDADEDDPFYDVCVITEANADFYKKYTGNDFDFDFNKYNYFLYYESDE